MVLNGIFLKRIYQLCCLSFHDWCYATLTLSFNPLRTAMAVLLFKYFRGIRANGFFQPNTAIFFREILLFYFSRGSSFCIMSPNLPECNFFSQLPRKLEFGKYCVHKCFLSHFQLQKPPGWHHKTRMVG